MSTKKAENRVGLMFEADTGLTAPVETGLNPQHGTQLNPAPRTKRPYKKRARKCACGCGEAIVPTPQAPHKRFVDDNHRKRWHRQQEAKLRASMPKPEPVLELTTCQYCGNTFLAEQGKGAKWCKPSHGVMAAEARRAAAEQVFVEVYNMTPDAVTDMIDNGGMKNASAFLRQQGYFYDETARRWLIAVQPGDVFDQHG